MKQKLKFLSLKGKEIFPYINDIAKLRITVFKEYPYLYEGDFEYEANYLKTYLRSECTVILVCDENKVVGASTAIPMAFETSEIQKPFVDLGMEISKIFYFGESVLLPAYRGQGIYAHFFNAREKAAREYGCQFATFCAVERAQNDSRKPKDYVSLERYWEKIGYKKHSEIFTFYSWKEIGEHVQSPKKMNFWIKTF